MATAATDFRRGSAPSDSSASNHWPTGLRLPTHAGPLSEGYRLHRDTHAAAVATLRRRLPEAAEGGGERFKKEAALAELYSSETAVDNARDATRITAATAS